MECSTYHTSGSQRNKNEAFLPTICLNIQSLRENKYLSIQEKGKVYECHIVKYEEEGKLTSWCCIAKYEQRETDKYKQKRHAWKQVYHHCDIIQFPKDS